MREHVRILCVDDEENVLKALKRLFMDEDYEIITANSGPEGLAALEKDHDVQVVISDYRMPEVNGVDFLRQVFERWPETVRIVLSGFADTASVVGAINEGHIYKFIPKPWNDDELKVTIAKAVDVYFLLRNNERLTQELKGANEELHLLNEQLTAMVSERTNELVFRGKVIDHAQTLLNVMPLGVLGVDSEGTVVQSNRRAQELLARGAGLIGLAAQEVLPAPLLEIIADLPAQQIVSRRVLLNGQECFGRGASLSEDQERPAGCVVVFDLLS